MNAQQSRAFRRPQVAALFATAMLLSFVACSGGGTASTPTFSLQFVDPNESLDLNGGDKVIVHGSNFIAAKVARVLFGDGNPGFGLTVLSDTEIEITVPPSPSGNPGPVNVEVETLNFGTRGIFAGYTYADDGGGNTGPPVPQTIVPTNYTATGAESFTISGTNLGPSGGQIIVDFAGIGAVQATVSLDGQFARGNAPVAVGIPPATPIQVTVNNQGQGAEVPTRVNYNYLAPTSWVVGFQEGAGNASLPVRVGNGMAVVATSGTDALWGNGNDSLWLITGPPLASAVVDLFALQPAAVRRLDANNSVPIALDSDTVCIYSPGPDGIAVTGDEVVLVVSGLQTATPVVRPPLAVAFLSPAPLARISSTRIATTSRGTGTALQDELRFVTVNAGVPALSATRRDIGLTDLSALAGRLNRSIPFTPDGDTVFVFSVGLPASGVRVFGDSDDRIWRHVVSTGVTTWTSAPFLLDTPNALSPTRLVAPAKGVATVSVNDNLAIYDHSGVTFSAPTYITTGSLVQTGAGAMRPIIAPLGNGNVVLPLGPPNLPPGGANDRIGVFREDGAGGFTQLNLNLAGRPLMTPLGDGSLVVFGRGVDLAPGTFDDRVLHIKADGGSFAEFAGAPLWMHGTLAASDETRVFAVGAGIDLLYGSGDEELLVFQAKSLGSGVASATLPLSHSGFIVRAGPAQARTRFVPVGPGWGLMQSPGFGPTAAFLRISNRVIVVNY